MTMTKKIVSWLACMAVFLIFYSCNTESFEESPAASANTPKFSIVTRSQMNSVKGLLARVGQMERKMSLRKGAALKTRQDSLLEGATIVTETALLIQNGERKTYTFKVTRPGNPSYVENLAVKNNADGTYSGILIRYMLDGQEVITTSNGHGLDFSGKINIYPIEELAMASRVVTQSSGCYSVTWETGVCASGQHHYGDACSLTGDNRAGVPQIVSVTNRCAGSAVGHLSEYSDGNQGGADYDTWVYYGPGGSTVQEPEDPCEKAQIPTGNINTLLHDSNISSEMNALENYAANNHYEYGAAIINTGNSNVAQTPYTNNDPNNPGHVSINIPPVGNFVASAHTHPNHGAAPPSARDLYTTLENARDYPSYQGSFVFSYNGSKYAFVVNDRAKAQAFLLAFPFANNTTNEGRIFNKNSQVGKDFLEIYDHYMEGRLSSYSVSSQVDGLESAYTMIFEKYDIGITLSKTDNLGNLKPLRSIKFTHTVTASGGKQIIGYKAIECP